MPLIDFSAPDESRQFPNGQWELVHTGPTTIAKGVFQPGWRWSHDVKPLAGTETCQHRHVGLAISGRIHVKMEDGSEFEIDPGAAYTIEPGHDAWVVGDQPVVMYEFSPRAAEEYAKKA